MLTKRYRAVFLDIDGTLVDYSQHMPKSTKEALSLARKNGHKVFICTGRPYGMIDTWLLDIGFDGVVASAGAYVEAAGQVIFHQTLEQDLVKKVIDILRLHGAEYLIQNQKCSYMTQGFYEQMNGKKKKEESGAENLPNSINGRLLTEEVGIPTGVEGIDYFKADIPIDQMRALFESQMAGYFDITGSSFGTDQIYSAEITRRGITKGTGMEHMLKHFGMERENSFGIGDGMNDLNMLQYAGVSIAMGNAIGLLKEAADYVTAAVNEDGVWKAFRQYRLI